MRFAGPLIALGVCLAAAPADSAQEIEELLHKTAVATGSSGVKTVRFSVAGTGYEVGPGTDPSRWTHVRIEHEIRELDLEHLTLRIGNHLVDTNSPWEQQIELWSTPEAFLKGASTAKIVGEFKQGQDLYQLVMFNVADKLV